MLLDYLKLCRVTEARNLIQTYAHPRRGRAKLPVKYVKKVTYVGLDKIREFISSRGPA